MSIKLHTCEITRAFDLYGNLSLIELQARLSMLRSKGENAKRALETGNWDMIAGHKHESNKALATYTTHPRIVLRMCRRDYALTRMIYRAKGGKGF